MSQVSIRITDAKHRDKVRKNALEFMKKRGAVKETDGVYVDAEGNMLGRRMEDLNTFCLCYGK